MGTHVAAARPVRARPAARTAVVRPTQSTTAPAADSTNPPAIKIRLRPVASTAMPTGMRASACHRPYIEMTSPTTVRLPVLASIVPGRVGM